MRASGQLAARVRRLLALVLPHGLQVGVKPRHAAGPSFDVTVTAGATKHRFIVGWAGEGWPSDVERLVHLAPDVDVVTATHLSDGARMWVEREGLGWADEAGRADISMKSGLVIFRQSSTIRQRRGPSMGWTRSTLAVAEAALSGTTPTVESIEQATGLSRHATANALSRLEDLGFLERPRETAPEWMMEAFGNRRRLPEAFREVAEPTEASNGARSSNFSHNMSMMIFKLSF